MGHGHCHLCFSFHQHHSRCQCRDQHHHLPTGRYSPDILAAFLDVSLSTIDSWHSSGDGPPLVKLAKPVRTTVKDVELWQARPLERSPG